ncbi:MAG: sigma-70 family RNA polymerase sigma factor [Nannocystaceae bacterium]
MDRPRSRLADLYRAHFDFTWRSLRHLGVAPAELDDAAQEVFVVLLRREDALPPELPLRAWLYGVIRRIASRHHRGRRRRARFEDAVAVEPTAIARPRGHDLDRDLDRREAVELLDEFLDGLTPGQREVFVLAELEERSGREIAELLDLNPNTVSTRLRAAREAFERRFTGLRAEYQRLHGRGRGRGGRSLALSLSRRGHAPTTADRRRVGALLGLSGGELAWADEVDDFDVPEGTGPMDPVDSDMSGETSSFGAPGEGAAIDAGLRQVVAATTTSPLTALTVGAGVALIAALVISAPRPEAAGEGAVAAQGESPALASTRREARGTAPGVEALAVEEDEAPASTAMVRSRGVSGSTGAGARVPGPPPPRSTEGDEASRSPVDGAPIDGALAAELALVEAIRGAEAAGASARALDLASDHALRFPDGALARERDGLRISALCHLGRAAEAEALAERLARTIEDPGALARFLAPCDDRGR